MGLYLAAKFLETIHGSERDYDIAATLGAIRMLVESEV